MYFKHNAEVEWTQVDGTVAKGTVQGSPFFTVANGGRELYNVRLGGDGATVAVMADILRPAAVRATRPTLEVSELRIVNDPQFRCGRWATVRAYTIDNDEAAEALGFTGTQIAGVRLGASSAEVSGGIDRILQLRLTEAFLDSLGRVIHEDVQY